MRNKIFIRYVNNFLLYKYILSIINQKNYLLIQNFYSINKVKIQENRRDKI